MKVLFEAILIVSQPEPEYDFIVVGAGTAGGVVANRLSECHDWKVLLLEAGGPPPDSSEVPFLQVQTFNTEWDWKYRFEPPRDGQAYCLAMKDQKCLYPRGKVVGGSGILNGLDYIRGNKRDYDDWEAMGNEGWGYDNVLKYFLKSEDNSNPCYLRTPFHASGGYLSVEDVRYTSPLAQAYIGAGESVGYKNCDANGENQECFMINQYTGRTGSRYEADKAFIEPVQRRPNLDLSMNSFVTKIGFEEGHSRPVARTLTYIKDGKMQTVRVSKEIILSAGAINSPQLLMLSGIGLAKHLNDLEIKVLKDLPVGYNYQDHVGGGGLSFRVSENVTIKPAVVENPDVLEEYFVSGRGPLTTTLSEVVAFVNSKYANQSRPDINFQFLSGSTYNQDLSSIENTYNLRPELFYGTEYQHLDKNGNYFSILVILLRPKSKGWVKLRSRNPYDHPIINPNFFTKRQDIEALIDCYQKALELVDTPPLKKYNAVPVRLHFPGCEGLRLFSNEYFECFIRQFTRSNYHAVGTCRMGIDSEAVVDPRLRVIGVEGLRVIDGSIMPEIVAGNVNAPIFMIGEKGSDLIKEDWNHLGKCAEQHNECMEDQRCSKPRTEQYFECNEEEAW